MQVHPAPQAPSGLPPSPTLTNPDMILPFDLPQSPIIRDTGSPVTSGEEERRARSNMKDPQARLRHSKQNLSPFRNGILTSHDGSLARSNSDRQHGRIKVENSRLTFRPNGDGPKPKPGSPLVDDDIQGMHTVPESSEEDDEVATGRNTYKTPSILDEDENDPESHAAMTKRAEEILANAKKRLNNMEGNLSRARSTLGSRPSSSMSSFADRDSPYNREKVSRLKHRQGHLMLKDDHQGHSRVFSETSVPSSLQSPTKANGNDTTVDKSPEPARNWFWNGLGRSAGGAEKNTRGLQRLDEDDTIDSFERQQAAEELKEANVAIDRSSSDDQPQLSPTYGLSRSRSTNQMRDLKDQMTDLKGKITSLRQKAREDSLKRRSLQSLRTPSPLNNAEQDYSKIPLSGGQDRGPEMPFNKEQQEQKSSSRREEAEKAPSLQASIPPKDARSDELKSPDVIDSAISMSSPTPQSPAGYEQHVPVNASTARDLVGQPRTSQTGMRETAQPARDFNAEPAKLAQEDAQVSETPQAQGDSAVKAVDEENEIEDDFEEPAGERHEDRADAFDYEHFFLTSSMGHYRRKRGSTHSSEYSTETERPPTMVLDSKIEEADETDDSPTRHLRQHSNSSISSLATFATATEGEESEVGEEKEWTPRQTMAGTWLVDAPATEVNGFGRKSSKVGTRQTLDTKQEMSVKRHRREHSVTDEGVNAPVPEAPDLMAYLKAVLSKEAGSAVDLALNDSDRELAERVVKSLANVCLDLQGFGKDGGKYEARVCRRRIDTARRHLDGEVNGEAF